MPATANETWAYTMQGKDTAVAVAGEGAATFTPDTGGVGWFFGPTSGATIPDIVHDTDTKQDKPLNVPAGKYLYLIGPQDRLVAVTAATVPA